MDAMCGVCALSSSKSVSGSDMPASCAIAGRCSAVFVEPPMSMSRTIAFRNDASVTMSRGVTPFTMRSTIRFPVASAMRLLRASTAGVVAQ